MNDTVRQEREDEFRANAARLIQATRQYLRAGEVPDDAAPVVERVRHLAGLLQADAPTEHLREAALAVVDSYEWPRPEADSSDEGPVIDAAFLGAVERLRDAIDALDALDDDR